MLRLRLLSLRTFCSHVDCLQLLCLGVACIAFAAEAGGVEAGGSSGARPAQVKAQPKGLPRPDALTEGKGDSKSASVGQTAEDRKYADVDDVRFFRERTNQLLGLEISSYTFLTDPDEDVQVGQASCEFSLPSIMPFVFQETM